MSFAQPEHCFGQLASSHVHAAFETWSWYHENQPGLDLFFILRIRSSRSEENCRGNFWSPSKAGCLSLRSSKNFCRSSSWGLTKIALIDFSVPSLYKMVIDSLSADSSISTFAAPVKPTEFRARIVVKAA